MPTISIISPFTNSNILDVHFEKIPRFFRFPSEFVILKNCTSILITNNSMSTIFVISRRSISMRSILLRRLFLRTFVSEIFAMELKHVRINISYRAWNTLAPPFSLSTYDWFEVKVVRPISITLHADYRFPDYQIDRVTIKIITAGGWEGNVERRGVERPSNE